MPRAKLGHAHLLVRNIEISTEFYTSVLGLRVTEFEPDKWAFLTSGDLHHELALSQLGMEAPGPEEGRVGLFHLAFDVDSKADFAKIVNILIDRGIDVEPVDHRIGWGAYFSDPDGNCIPAPYRERLDLKNQVLIPVSCSSRQIGTNP